MEKFYEKSIGVIETITAIGFIIYGAGYGVVILQGGDEVSPVGDVLTSPFLIAIYCVGFVLAGIMVLLGRKFKLNFLASQGLFMLCVSQIFRIISICLTSGFFEPFWVPGATTLAATAALWMVRQLGVRNAS